MGRFKKYICCFTSGDKEDSYEISRRDETDPCPLEETASPKISVYHPFSAHAVGQIHSLNESADFNPPFCSTKIHPDSPPASKMTCVTEETLSSCSDFGLTEIPSYPGSKVTESSDPSFPLKQADAIPMNNGADLDTTLMVENSTKGSFDSRETDSMATVEKETRNANKFAEKVNAEKASFANDVAIYKQDDVFFPNLSGRDNQFCAESLQDNWQAGSIVTYAECHAEDNKESDVGHDGSVEKNNFADLATHVESN